MTRKCILDSSSAILLYKTGIVTTLLDCYETFCPPEVFHELTRMREYPGAAFFLEAEKTGLLSIRSPSGESKDILEILHVQMGAGEAACIALYLESVGDFIILDDRKGAAWCRKNNAPYVNALLVPAIFHKSGIWSDGKYIQYFDALKEIGRYSEKIVQYAQSADLSRLSLFFPEK